MFQLPSDVSNAGEEEFSQLDDQIQAGEEDLNPLEVNIDLVRNFFAHSHNEIITLTCIMHWYKYQCPIFFVMST